MKKYRKKQIGQRLRDSRIKRFNGSVNMKDFAEMCGIPYRTYQNWELGIREPNREKCRILANRLKCDLSWLEHGEKPEMSNFVKDLIKTHYPNQK